MEPAYTSVKNCLPVKITWLQLSGSLMAAVVKHHRRANAIAAVAVNGRHVGSIDAVVFEVAVERLHTHRSHTFGNQVANGIVHYGGRDASSKSKAVRQVGGAIELSATDVDLALSRFAERHDSRIQPMD